VQFTHWQGDTEVGDVTADSVREYLAHERQRGLSPHTVKRSYAAISAFYTWLTDPDIGLAGRNPTDSVRAPRLPKTKPKALTRQEIEALLGAADQMALKRRARAIILFLLDTGCRASGLCGVALADIGFSTGKVLVTGS
jgi:integrase/recombinase XerC